MVAHSLFLLALLFQLFDVSHKHQSFLLVVSLLTPKLPLLLVNSYYVVLNMVNSYYMVLTMVKLLHSADYGQ